MAQALLASVSPVYAVGLPSLQKPNPVKLSIVPAPVSTLSPFLDIDKNEAIAENQDPLDSPYPVPWNWVLKTQARSAQAGNVSLDYFRSPALVSPDGQYAAYSRIALRSQPELYNSKVVSVMFLENLKTGELQVIRAASPIAAYLDKVGEESTEMAGVISILMPVSWSADGDRLLARQLEGAFNSSDVSDYGVVWNRLDRQIKTLSASPQPDEEISATLLGWDKNAPDQVLFRANDLGNETEQLVSVNLNGKLYLAEAEKAITYGQQIRRSWTGVQAIR